MTSLAVGGGLSVVSEVSTATSAQACAFINDGFNSSTTTPVRVAIICPGGGGSSAQPTISSDRDGFDTCSAPSTSAMQSWWHNSPYWNVGIYIAGPNRCDTTQANLNAAWISTLSGQGWGFLPINVSYQAPYPACTSQQNTYQLTANTSGDYNLGVAAADNGTAAASSLGLSGGSTPIYLDLEPYYPNNTYQGVSCRSIVESFLQGYTQQMLNDGYPSGIYTTPGSGMSDFISFPVVPNDVWVAAWDGVDGTWAINGLSDSLWVNDQRHHQFQGGHTETYAGVTINIDNDCSNGDIAAGYSYGEGADNEAGGSTTEDPHC